jgi:hypothetical protein
MERGKNLLEYHNKELTMNTRKTLVSSQTRNNWFIVLMLTVSGLLVTFSSIYFLFLPNGGYQGGRNPAYGIVVFFERSTWDLIHTWAGVAMVAVAALHIPLHWSWVVRMTKRVFKMLFGMCEGMNGRAKYNLLINGLIGLSGVIAALSSLYFLFFPGSQIGSASTVFLFSRSTWDVIHTWSGVTMLAAAFLHVAIHWRWIVNVAGKLLGGLEPKADRLAQQGNPLQ